MSRDIKFRAWDKELKEMLYTESVEWFDDGVYFRFNKHEEDLEHHLMRNTGIKDKNGIEIYEGDILERYGYWSIRIESDKGCLMVRDLDEVRYNNLILNVPICNFESINDWKVIGNIYENPELLEGEK